jgi:xanthine dehydrogenase YagT iron-sulfur-binding subunit
MSTSHSAHRVSPPRVGELAPDFALPSDAGAQHLADFRGMPVVVAFHESCWDPARIAEIDSYSQLVGGAGETAHQPTLIRNDTPEAELYGVAGSSAVFVVDPEGRVAWRYVRGVDCISSLNEARLTRPSGDTAHGGRAGWSRRHFVATSLAAAIAIALEPLMNRTDTAAAVEPDRAPVREPAASSVGAPVPVTLAVNGQRLALTLEPRVTLLDALREYAGLTGTKKGCDHGQCGACTVHVDGRRTLSCLALAVMQQGKQITTIEGLAASAGAKGDALHPMQQAFIEHDGFQCGYCTSGQLMSATAMVQEPWGPSDDDVREAMSGNICRCGAYAGIVAAVQDVRRHGGQHQ